MFETTIRLKPRSAWRAGMTPEHLIEELDRTVRGPGLTNVWVPPIRNRIDMLATGVKSPIGVKVSGPDLAAIQTAAEAIEVAARKVVGVSSSVAERSASGRYVDIDIIRASCGIRQTGWPNYQS
jgi:Cu(I)/Ag(I) efflux system membrane protein CusA/SilA